MFVKDELWLNNYLFRGYIRPTNKEIDYIFLYSIILTTSTKNYFSQKYTVLWNTPDCLYGGKLRHNRTKF